MEAYYLSSFTEKIGGGNKAAVVFDNDQITDIQRLEIAHKIGFSETAFLKINNEKAIVLRFFTPLQEVGLCGHAALAAVELALNQKLISESNKEISLITQEGDLRVSTTKSDRDTNTIFIEQPSAKFAPEIKGQELADLSMSLGLSRNEIGINNEDLFPQPVYTGLWDVICPIKDIKSLINIKPNFEKIKQLSIKYGVTGIHCIYYDRKSNIIHARNFAPLVGIDEETATGTSSGAASAYLVKALNLKVPVNFVFYQGQWMDSPSEIYSTIKENFTPWVGGSAVIVSRETI